MSNQCAISFGDTVRHPKHPEWGTGAVTKVEQTAINGEPTIRVAVRFKSAGLKTFAGASLPLEVMQSEFSMPGDALAKPAIAEVESLEQLRWLDHDINMYAFEHSEEVISVDNKDQLEYARSLINYYSDS